LSDFEKAGGWIEN